MEINKSHAGNIYFKKSTLSEPKEFRQSLLYQLLEQVETSSGVKCARYYEFMHMAQMGIWQDLRAE